MNVVLRKIDAYLNKITMYRLLVYGLVLLLAIATVFSYAGVLSTSGTGILASTTVLIIVCYGVNKALSYAFNAPVNNESYLITALILACILPPSTTVERLSYIALAGAFAMSSKFILAHKHKHIFNPAAIGAVVLSLLGLMSVTWWIGNPSMLPFVLVFGLLVTRKIRHFELVYVFLVAAALMITLVAVLKGVPVGTQLLNAVKSGPLIFLATIMLTEPATMPSQHNWQLLFALLVGTLYASQLRLGIFSTSPHMVLAAGNIFAFVVSPAVKTRLRFKQKIMISPNVAEYIFTPSPHFNYIAGQYVDWTLPHKHVDGRGNRHTFTLASSPTESTVSLGVKFYTPSSTYKTALAALKPGDTISVGHISGNFIMPSDPSQKLVFIAGGIGITPFRSMVKYLTDTNQKRDITLFYASANPQEFAFMDVFKAAVSVGVKTVQILGGPPPPANWQGYTGQLTADILQKEVPDYKTRQYYISGPNGLVVAYKDLLKANGVKGTQIHTDYFSGY